MSKVRVELNHGGVAQLLKSPEMLAVVEGYAAGALGRLGEGYSVNSRVGRGRVNAEVVADTAAARRENLKNNTILKALK